MLMAVEVEVTAAVDEVAGEVAVVEVVEDAVVVVVVVV